MSGPRITDAAVEAGARAQWAEYWSDTEAFDDPAWVDDRDSCLKDTRMVLTAAIPHLHRAWLEGLIAELDGLHKRSIAHSMGRSSNWSTAAGALRDLRAEIAELEGVGE